MKTSVVFSVLLAVTVSYIPAAANPVQVEAPIGQVTVYRDRAEVVREGKVSLAEGITELRVSSLPHVLLDASVQVSGSGAAAATLLDTAVETGTSAVQDPPRLRELLDRKAELEHQQSILRDRENSLEQRRRFLEKIEGAATQSPKEPGALPGLEDWTRYLEFLGRQYDDLFAARREVQTETREVADELKKVEEAIRAFRATQGRPAKTIVVRVQSEQGGDLQLRISYQVPNASWQPVYDAYVDQKNESVRLRYRALVRQQTGEEWDGVVLRLSTAQPSLRGTPPTLPTWRLRPFVPPQPRRMDTRSRAAETDAVMLMAPEAASMDMGLQEASVVAGITASTFIIPGRTSVAADGSSQAVTVSETSLNTRLEYTIVPSRQPQAFLMAETTHSGQAPLLPGAVTVFLENTMVGQTRLGMVQPGEKFELPLGINEAIKVERKLIRRFVETTGLINKTRRITFEFVTTIENQSIFPARLLVKDQIPVSDHERVRVTLREPPESHFVEDRPGEVNWRFELDRGAKRDLRLIFIVEHPDDMELQGL